MGSPSPLCVMYKKSPANANRNVQQWCMFESPIKQSLTQSPEGTRRPAAIIYSVLLVLTRGRHLYRSANTVSVVNRKFFPPPLI